MIYLNGRDVEACVDFGDLIAAIGQAYKLYGKDEFYMPDRIHIDHGKQNLLYMPCFKSGIFGTKILTVFPENKGTHPIIDGLMLLNDSVTGAPKALLDGKMITALRTAAVGGFGVDKTTPPTVDRLGIIGAGVQGYYQALMACQVRDFKHIYVYDLNKDNLAAMVSKLEFYFDKEDIEIVAVTSSEDLVKKSEVIITATTSKQAVIPHEWQKLKNKHFIGIGSYKEEMREYPDQLFSKLDKVIVDTRFACEESGDLIVPLRLGNIQATQIVEFSEYLKDENEIKRYSQGTTLFKSVGMALFDVVVSELIYNKSIEKEIGQNMVT